MHRPTLAALLVVTVVAAGCGGDDDTDSAEAASTSTSTSTTHDHNAMEAVERDEEPAAADRDDRCDLGFNTGEFNDSATQVAALHEHSMAMQSQQVDFTVQEWADVFVDPALGVPPEAVAAAIEANPDMRSIILGGLVAETLEPDSWVPMTDPDECEALAGDLRAARAAAARYPTAAEAMADGYVAGSVYVPGKGAHFSKPSLVDETLDVDQPELLMFDGLEPSSRLMGMAYFIRDPEGVADDEGFAGTSDRWHGHDTNCTDDRGVAIAPTECDAGRGHLQTGLNLWMLHTWVVPGCESPWGVFSGTNPRLPVIPPGGGVTLEAGCNTGKTLDDPLDFEATDGGPQIS